MRVLQIILGLSCAIILGWAIYNIVWLFQYYENSQDKLQDVQQMLKFIKNFSGYLILIVLIIIVLLKNKKDFINRD